MEGKTKGVSHLEKLEGDDLLKGREIVFQPWENKTEKGCRDVKSTRE